jgi:hypothetical protein
MSEEVEIGVGGNTSYGYRTEEDLLAPIGAPPEFSEPIEAVRTGILESLGHVSIPHKVPTWHPAIERLLKEDEKRREKQLTGRYVMSWEKPVFDSPFERRRLRILNSLFFAVQKMTADLRSAAAKYGTSEFRSSSSISNSPWTNPRGQLAVHNVRMPTKTSQWALAQADRIDPAIGGRFLTVIQDEEAG